MIRKLLIFALLFSMVLGLSLTAQAKNLYDPVEEPAMGGKYYLCATVDGVDYYYRLTDSAKSESTSDTSPYSLYVTDDPNDKNIKEFTLGTAGNAFYLGYTVGEKVHKIYLYDPDKDDVMDTNLTAGLDIRRSGFYWDDANKYIFAMLDDVKYVLVVKTMKNLKSGNEELHMLAIPSTDLAGEEKVYPVRFVKKHAHVFSDNLISNEYSHWHECACGQKDGLQLHQVDSWTVTKEAAIDVEGSRTGVCTVCGATAVEKIPALKDKSTAPAETVDGTESTEPAVPEQSAPKMDPVVITVAAVLVALGVVILFFGKKREKK